jgi:hypothetical protein
MQDNNLNPQGVAPSNGAESESQRKLSPEHLRALLEESAIAPEVVSDRGYFTATDSAELEKLDLAQYQRRVPALVVPVYGVDGKLASIVLALTTREGTSSTSSPLVPASPSTSNPGHSLRSATRANGCGSSKVRRKLTQWSAAASAPLTFWGSGPGSGRASPFRTGTRSGSSGGRSCSASTLTPRATRRFGWLARRWHPTARCSEDEPMTTWLHERLLRRS